MDRFSSHHRDHLIVFARFPTPGATKTRLIPAIGAERAADISRELTEQTLTTLSVLSDLHLCSVEVRVTGADLSAFRDTFGEQNRYVFQSDGNLGHRMSNAASEAFAGGARRVVAIGTDCPELEPVHVLEAFTRLQECDIVVGPAADGGYYLLGQSRAIPELFNDIEWGSSRVLEQTCERAAKADAPMDFLQVLSDVDCPNDLLNWEHRKRPGCQQRPRVSVIIPALNEEETISRAIQSASGSGIEVVVVDGGSTDRTMALAAKAGAKVIRAQRCRARQMNAGAAVAKGEVLLFLHADTTLPEGFDGAISHTLEQPDVCACAFRLSIDAKGWSFRLIERLVDLRSRLFQMPYGDQALSLRARTFRDIGGFRGVPIMEDYVLMRRLRRAGRIEISPLTAVTSARRWLLRGVWRATVTNQACIAAYRIGVSPARIARWREDSDAPRFRAKAHDTAKSECPHLSRHTEHVPDSCLGVHYRRA